jgi:hypothetical protein
MPHELGDRTDRDGALSHGMTPSVPSEFPVIVERVLALAMHAKGDERRDGEPERLRLLVNGSERPN